MQKDAPDVEEGQVVPGQKITSTAGKPELWYRDRVLTGY